MTARTRIKVCGITEMADARAAVEAGVDALGFIFAPKSPRLIDPQKARDIVASLPPFVDAVGVFVDEEFDVVQEIIQYCRLTMVQLHGQESPEYCQNISCRVLKSFRVSRGQVRAGLVDFGAYFGAVEGFLLDTYQEGVAGGTGQAFDWQLVEEIQPPGPVVLAGGLTPENIGEAVRVARPFAVDMNSGVEVSPGRKDSGKIEQAVGMVRQADEELAAVQ